MFQRALKKVKRQHTHWMKIFDNYISDKGLASKICKEQLQLNDKKTAQSKIGQKISIGISLNKIYNSQ